MTGSSVTVTSFADIADLPPDCDALFAVGGRDGLYSSRVWYRVVVTTSLPPDASPCFVLVQQDRRSIALFPLQTRDDGRTLQSLTTPYTCLHQPLIGPATGMGDMHRIGEAFGQFCRKWSTVQIDALDADWCGLPPLLAGMRASGLLPLQFAHFGNWYEQVAGLSWDCYLRQRPGALRETIRRKLRGAEQDPRFSLQLIRRADEVEMGIAAYEDVCRRSWKAPEPFPRFNAVLMHEAAALDILRLGVLRYDGRPIAAQYWIVDAGRASLAKLAHDRAANHLSPGTVLTAMLVREMLQNEAVDELDFGRGNDPYKRLWMTQWRQRVGVVLANPRRPAGLAVLARRVLGRSRALLRAVA